MPPADNTHHLLAATRARAEQARARAEAAIAAAARAGQHSTVVAIAHTAAVSRSWLYTQPDLIDAIGQLQQRRPAPTRSGPQPATVRSLQTRLETLQKRNTALRAEVRDLTVRLEAAHGELRQLRLNSPHS
jgi:Family of unknown function (DUF6262)